MQAASASELWVFVALAIVFTSVISVGLVVFTLYSLSLMYRVTPPFKVSFDSGFEL
jgi:hypothetical protein